MVTEITFRGWQRPAIGALVDSVQGGRPLVRTTVEAQGRDADGEVTRTETVRLSALLSGPGDVTGLQRGAIVTRFPTPGTIDAETNKCPYVEFADPALPWRYTPRRTPSAIDRVLQPWLALLVGTDDEVEVTGEVVKLGESALRDQPISPALAHVQESGDSTLARVLSRRGPLVPATRYTAVLVPTFVVVDGGLRNAWSSNQQGPVTLPVYASWRFTTGPGGDFRTLATQLKPGEASDTTGLAPLRYPRLSPAPQLHVGGALTATEGPPEEPLPDEVRDDLRKLRFQETDDPDFQETDEAGRRIIGLPRYGEAWHEEPDDLAWGATLNSDPRHRGVAGLGLRLAVELQEELAELAAQHAGALEVAAERVRHLTLGLAAAGSLWERRMPAGPGRRIWLLAPALRRVMTETGSVEARATADDRPLEKGWFSTATRRALRRGPARTAFAQQEAADPAKLNSAANQAPPPVPFVEAGLPGLDEDAPQFEERRAAIAGGAIAPADRMLGGVVSSLNMNRFPQLAAQLATVQARTVTNMEESRPLPWVQLSLLLASIGEGEDDPVFDQERATPLVRALAEGFDEAIDEPQVVRDLLNDLGDRPEAALPPVPLELGPVAEALVAAFDPTVAEAAARRRIIDNIAGLGPTRPLEPPEACPGFDVPVWRKLADMEPDWLLPGVGQLGDNSVIAVGTNPAFVDAFLAGFNTRLLEELRWRNLRVATGCTPVRTFWFRSDGTSGDRVDDIRGIQNWTNASKLGDAQHRPGGLSGTDLVLVFRGQLFIRYPKTLLYLVSAGQNGEPDFTKRPEDDTPRTLPTFQGRIGSDVTFFGFVGMDPESVNSFWVGLEEPPSGVQFRNDDEDANQAADGAQFADDAFDNPTRVLIQGNKLVPS